MNHLRSSARALAGRAGFRVCDPGSPVSSSNRRRTDGATHTHEIRTHYDKDLTGLADHIVGYDVEAIDGHIGTIDEAINETTTAYLVVDTGPWIFGRKILLPAGIVTDIDGDAQKVFVNRSKEQVKDPPDYAGR